MHSTAFLNNLKPITAFLNNLKPSSIFPREFTNKVLPYELRKKFLLWQSTSHFTETSTNGSSVCGLFIAVLRTSNVLTERNNILKLITNKLITLIPVFAFLSWDMPNVKINILYGFLTILNFYTYFVIISSLCNNCYIVEHELC